jgi:hypothetical protein
MANAGLAMRESDVGAKTVALAEAVARAKEAEEVADEAQNNLEVAERTLRSATSKEAATSAELDRLADELGTLTVRLRREEVSHGWLPLPHRSADVARCPLPPRFPLPWSPRGSLRVVVSAW